MFHFLTTFSNASSVFRFSSSIYTHYLTSLVHLTFLLTHFQESFQIVRTIPILHLYIGLFIFETPIDIHLDFLICFTANLSLTFAYTFYFQYFFLSSYASTLTLTLTDFSSSWSTSHKHTFRSNHTTFQIIMIRLYCIFIIY